MAREYNSTSEQPIKPRRFIMSWLWRLGVGDPELLRACPAAERRRYALSGLSILLFALIAVISGIYLSGLIFGASVFSIFLGLGLAINIIIIYQLALSTISSRRLPHTAHLGFPIFSVALRTALLAFILLLVAKPFELYVFQHGLETDLTGFRQAQEKHFREQNLAPLNQAIIAAEAEIRVLQDAIAKMEARSKLPRETEAQERLGRLDALYLQTERRSLARKEQQMQRLQIQAERYLKKFLETNQKSTYLIPRLRFLHQRHPISWGITIALGLIFFFPFFSRLYFVDRDTYYIKCDNSDYKLILTSYQAFKLAYRKAFIQQYGKKVECPEHCADPPFCTKKRVDERPVKDKADLIEWLQNPTA